MSSEDEDGGDGVDDDGDVVMAVTRLMFEVMIEQLVCFQGQTKQKLSFFLNSSRQHVAIQVTLDTRDRSARHADGGEAHVLQR